MSSSSDERDADALEASVDGSKTRHSRDLLMALVGAGSLITAHLISWSDARSSSLAFEYAETHRESARKIHLAAFQRDWSNRISGTITSEITGQPINGALIRVYQDSELTRAIGVTLLGEWPEPIPLATALSNAKGAYVLEGLPYAQYPVGTTSIVYRRPALVSSTLRSDSP